MKSIMIGITILIGALFYNLPAHAEVWHTFTPSHVIDQTGHLGVHTISVGIAGSTINGCGSFMMKAGTNPDLYVPDDEIGAAAVNRAFSLILTTVITGKDITILRADGDGICYFKMVATVP